MRYREVQGWDDLTAMRQSHQYSTSRLIPQLLSRRRRTLLELLIDGNEVFGRGREVVKGGGEGG